MKPMTVVQKQPAGFQMDDISVSLEVIEQRLGFALEFLELSVRNVRSREYSKLRPECRPIAVSGLRRVAEFIDTYCSSHRWASPLPGSNGEFEIVSDPAALSINNFVYNVIAPVTAPIGHEVAEAPAGASLELASDGRVPGGFAIERLVDGSRRFRYVRGAPPDPEPAQADRFVRTFSGSIAEMLCATERIAPWFCTHWWGQPMLEFIDCVLAHARDYLLGDTALYWLFVFAGNLSAMQLERGAEVSAIEYPFFRAVKLAQGGLLSLDRDSQVTRRAWIAFETAIVVHLNKSFAVSTVHGGKGHTLALEPVPRDHQNRNRDAAAQQRLRQRKFPSERLVAMLDTRLEKANSGAAREVSFLRNCIEQILGGYDNGDRALHTIAAATLFGLGEVRVAATAALNKANQPYSLQGEVRHLVEARSDHNLGLWMCRSLRLQGEDASDDDATTLGKSLVQAVNLESISLDFHGSKVQDTGVKVLARALGTPVALKLVSLDFEMTKIGDSGVAAIGAGLGLAHHLVSVALDFSETKVGNAGLIALASSLAHVRTLTSVDFSFYGTQVADKGVLALGAFIMKSIGLERISLNLSGTRVGDEALDSVVAGLTDQHMLNAVVFRFAGTEIGDSGVASLGASLAFAHHLTSVELFFDATTIGDIGAVGVGNGLARAKRLTSVSLNFKDTQVGDAGAAALGLGLRKSAHLSKVALDFSGTKVGDAGVGALGVALGAAAHLNSISLDFTGTLVGDAGATVLGLGLEVADQLSFVSLTFNHGPQKAHLREKVLEVLAGFSGSPKHSPTALRAQVAEW